MYAIGDLARQLNRPVLYVRGLQQRFDLAVFEGYGYSRAYLAFLQTVVHLRMLGSSEEALLKLWALEKKLMHLLHDDDAASPTWYLDSCHRKNRRSRRLLLSRHDIGVPLTSARLQLGIRFRSGPAELIKAHDMGEDAIQVLQRYLELYRRICTDAAAESRQLASAAGWGRTLKAD